MKKVEVKIEGIRPYIQHRRPKNYEEVEEIKQITKVLSKNPYDKEASRKEAEFGIYRNHEKQIYIPSTHIQEAMTKAGAREKVQGEGKRTFKDYMKSYVFPKEEEIIIEPQDYTIDTRYVKIQRSGILRNRPRFDKWGATFTLLVTDDSLPLDTIKTILETAGTRVGIGDYRPKYGLFEVVGWNEIK